MAACFLSAASALEPNIAISQYTRDRWGAEQGFPGGPVYAIAQTPDGYLWIGTEKGLVRFDGLNFVLMQRGNSEIFPAGPVLGLVADADGNLWIRQQGPILLRYRGGKFEDVSRLLQHREKSFTAMTVGRSGEVLISGLENGLVRHGVGGFTLDTQLGFPNGLAISLAETTDGRIWIGTRDAGLLYADANRVLSEVQGLPDKKINCLLASEGSELWIGTDNGVARLNGNTVIKTGLPPSLAHLHALTLLKDRESNIWIGSSSGLVRLNANGVSSTEASNKTSAEAVSALFEDREGNLWVGTPKGIERLRDREFTTYSISNGLPSDMNGPVYADSRGRIWFAPMEGGLHWLARGQSGEATNDGLGRDVIYSIAGDKDGIWIGRQRGGLTHLRFSSDSLTSETYNMTQGLAQNSIYAVHQARDGTVWAGTVSAGVSSFRNGKFTTYDVTNGLSSNTVSSILEGSDGTIWIGTPNGLNALSHGKWRAYSSREGLPPGTVNCLIEDSAGVLWIGTSNGLAFLRSGQVQTPQEARETLREPIFGIEEDKRGWLWIVGANHVLRVNREKLQGAIIPDEDVREYGLADGLQSTEGVRRHRSVVADSLGRIWLSMNQGISFINPTRVPSNSAPAIVHVEGISADGQRFDPGDGVRVPVPPQRITLSYSGLSLSVPARVRFKYKLDGFDSGWSEPTAAREVSYTNLGAGPYRFRVVASNSDGLWISRESSLQFEIAPVFWQTWWFRISSVLLLGLVILTFFRLRVMGMTKQMNMRFEERLAERTRIAQELHDTLLQGFLSASMQLHVANDRLPESSPAKPLVGRVLELMTHVIDEARNAVRGLRAPDAGRQNLEEAFSRIQQELAVSTQSGFRIFVEGQPRHIKPLIRDEVYFIGREALANAFRHSGASHIVMEVEYTLSNLRILVRDNGRGIDSEVLIAGRDGHWGLSGMRERAERIGARLRVMSRATAGTEVELSVPGRISYETNTSASGRDGAWFSRLYARKIKEPKAKIESGRQK